LVEFEYRIEILPRKKPNLSKSFDIVEVEIKEGNLNVIILND